MNTAPGFGSNFGMWLCLGFCTFPTPLLAPFLGMGMLRGGRQEVFMFGALFTDGDSGIEIPSSIWVWEA